MLRKICFIGSIWLHRTAGLSTSAFESIQRLKAFLQLSFFLEPHFSRTATQLHNCTAIQLHSHLTTQPLNYTATQLPNGLVPMTLPSCYIKALLPAAWAGCCPGSTGPRSSQELPCKGASCCLPGWLQASSLAFGKSAGSKVLSGWLFAPAFCLAQALPV